MKTTLTATMLAVAVLSFSPYAQAQNVADYGKFYVGIGAGVIVPQDTHITATGAVTGSGNLSYDKSAAIMGMAGYRLNDYVTGEGELAYSSMDYDTVSGTISGGGLPVSGSVNVNGHVSGVVGLANALITPLGHKNITPYIGGGIGFASTDSKISSLSAGGVTVADNVSNSATDLALDAIVGADFAVNDKFSLGGRYQYLWVNSAQSFTGSGITQKQDNFGANVVTAQATYHF